LKRFRCKADEVWILKAKDEDEAREKLSEEYLFEPIAMFKIEEINKNDPDWEDAQ